MSAPSTNIFEIVEEFESALRDGKRASIAEFLSRDGEVRRALLVELVHTEMEFALKSGMGVRVEDYLRRFPELADDHEAILELIATEYRFRRRVDAEFTADEYARRFPQLSGRLTVVVQSEQHTLQSGEPVASVTGREQRFGDYELISLIAQGGDGRCFQGAADDTRSNRGLEDDSFG